MSPSSNATPTMSSIVGRSANTAVNTNVQTCCWYACWSGRHVGGECRRWAACMSRSVRSRRVSRRRSLSINGHTIGMVRRHYTSSLTPRAYAQLFTAGWSKSVRGVRLPATAAGSRAAELAAQAVTSATYCWKLRNISHRRIIHYRSMLSQHVIGWLTVVTRRTGYTRHAGQYATANTTVVKVPSRAGMSPVPPSRNACQVARHHNTSIRVVRRRPNAIANVSIS